MREVKKIPKIDEISAKIAKNNLPIYRRVKEIENKKKLNKQKIKDFIIRENEITETSFINRCLKNTYDDLTFRNWYLSNENWYLKKILKNEKMKNKINQEKIEEESFTFKPVINKNSEKIFYKSYIYSKYPVIDRLLKAFETKQESINKIKNKESFNFIPNVNKQYTIRENYYEFMKEDQAELFNELKEKLENEEKEL